MIIYRITNHINNKVYIGLTTKKLNHRFNDHVSESNTRPSTLLHKAFIKYDVKNFSIESICSIITDNINDLHELEKYFIREYKSCVLDKNSHGYNMTRGGEFMDPETASYYNRKRIESGTHYLQSEKADICRKETLKRRIENGTHNFQGEAQSKFATKRNLERVANGTNPFCGPQQNNKRILEGTHNFIIVRTCPHCNLTGKGPNMLRYHFDNCKSLTLNTHDLL